MPAPWPPRVRHGKHSFLIPQCPRIYQITTRTARLVSFRRTERAQTVRELSMLSVANAVFGFTVSPVFVPLLPPVPTRTPVVQALDPFLNPVFDNPDVVTAAAPAVAQHMDYGTLATGLLVIIAH